MEFEPSEAIFLVVLEALEQIGIDCWHSRDKSRIFFIQDIPARISSVFFRIEVRYDSFSTYAVCPIHADYRDKNMMNSVGEFMNRVNYKVVNGAWKMDYANGQIVYQTHTICNDIIPTPEMVIEGLKCALIMYKTHGEGLLRIMFNRESPESTAIYCMDIDRLIGTETNSRDGTADK